MYSAPAGPGLLVTHRTRARRAKRPELTRVAAVRHAISVLLDDLEGITLSMCSSRCRMWPGQKAPEHALLPPGAR
jgi:hypothetical protein